MAQTSDNRTDPAATPAAATPATDISAAAAAAPGSSDDNHEGDDDPSSRLPIRFVSTVIPGYGRGSKELGIPTANLSRKAGTLRCSVEHFDDLPCGIYWGYARIGEKQRRQQQQKREEEAEAEELTVDAKKKNGGSAASASSSSSNGSSLGRTHTAAVSIGYNPTYANATKTVEPHLIAPAASPHRHSSKCGETQFQDFYGQPIRLSVVGYLRPELPFEGLEKLTAAIKGDIVEAEKLGSGGGEEEGGKATAATATARERRWVESHDENVSSVSSASSASSATTSC